MWICVLQSYSYANNGNTRRLFFLCCQWKGVCIGLFRQHTNTLLESHVISNMTGMELFTCVLASLQCYRWACEFFPAPFRFSRNVVSLFRCLANLMLLPLSLQDPKSKEKLKLTPLKEWVVRSNRWRRSLLKPRKPVPLYRRRRRRVANCLSLRLTKQW